MKKCFHGLLILDPRTAVTQILQHGGNCKHKLCFCEGATIQTCQAVVGLALESVENSLSFL